MSTTSIVVVLELDIAADCPSGTAAAPGGEPMAFHGWLGLATAIHALASTGTDGLGEGAETTTSSTEGELT